MRKVLISSAMVVALTGSAIAADMSIPPSRRGAVQQQQEEETVSTGGGGFSLGSLFSIPFRLAKVGTDAGAGIVTTLVSIPSATLSVFIPGEPAPAVRQSRRSSRSSSQQY